MVIQDKKLRVLFVCGGNSCRSQMAEGFLRSMGKDQAVAYSAGVTAEGVHPMAVRVMQAAGVDISRHKSKTVADLGQVTFDLIVTLCEIAEKYCSDSIAPSDDAKKSSLFIGMPIRLHWVVPDPAKAGGNQERKLGVFRSVRDQLKENIRAMLELGQLSALAGQRERTENILDAMEDGIIVHDQHRNIFLFNRAAEKITGYDRKEVLGANCHEVFLPDGLCGSRCPLNSGDMQSFDKTQYEVGFTTKDGEDRRLRIKSAPINMPQGNTRGVVATIRDVTEVSRLRRKMKEKYSFHGMVGASAAMQEVFRTIRQVTASYYPVLITGESGTGKELVAQAIHNESRRSAGPFVPINCGALPETILESELFGHVRGAFTGAIRDKKGRFELAHKGTLFLDEVGELSPAFQVKLLRVIEEKHFEQVGGERTIKVDVRVISATNRDLKAMIEKGTFRDDLFYRLSVVPFHLPPLRERRDDLPLLVERTLERIRGEIGKPIHSVSDQAMDLLMAYHWPGNIRELINVLQFASVRCDSEEITPRHFPPGIRTPGASPQPIDSAAPPAERTGSNGMRRRRKLDRVAVKQALFEVGGNKVKAAKRLGVGRATLYRFLNKYSVS
jgi:PAS domain S-box-containing protein